MTSTTQKTVILVGFIIKNSAQTNLKCQLANGDTYRAVSHFTIVVQVDSHRIIPLPHAAAGLSYLTNSVGTDGQCKYPCLVTKYILK